MKKQLKAILSVIIVVFIMLEKGSGAVEAASLCNAPVIAESALDNVVYETEGNLQDGTAAPEQLDLYARSAVLIDGSNNRILYGKNQDEVHPMASTTKIMTLVIALEYGDPDDIVTFSAYAASQPDVQLNALRGEQYRLEDLLYIMMLRSYNDVAVAIAEYIGELQGGGGVDGAAVAEREYDESKTYIANFARLMNDKAKELGCTDTYFITPNGLDAEDDNGVHSTTAYELAVIAAYAISKQEVVDICTTRSYSCSELNGKRNVSITTTNSFLDMADGAVGMKTGFTGNAGYCFVGAVKQEGRTFISVVLASGWPPNKSYKWSDTKKLMNYGIKNFFPQKIFVADNNYKNVKVTDGTGDYIETEIPYSLDMLVSDDEDIQIIYELAEEVEAPVKEGDIVGTVYIYINGEIYTCFPIKSKTNVAKVDYIWFLKKIVKDFLP